jgi:hypothetical protein
VEPVFRCPMCNGRIALWVVQSAFTCHHCRWALSSNIRAAISQAVVVAVIVELLLFAGLWLYVGSMSFALGVWLAAGCLLGFGAGWLFVRQAVRLVPLHPPRAVTSNPLFQPTAFGGG